MTVYTTDCPPFDTCPPCGPLPTGFVRLRYFYGKRLGVTDFVDEQRYHAGKLRFHNQHLHGAGVLCGLGVAVSTPGPVLRVGKGAAIDGCGREIVVGYDQCIDLADWFARMLREHAGTPDWPAGALVDGRLPACVVLRYRECASGPEPAPRDPCACDATGCDLGRVREEFELELVIGADAEHAGPAPFGAATAIAAALRHDRTRADLDAAVAAALASGCAEADGDAWLPIACMSLELDAHNAGVVAVHDLHGAASYLYAAAMLQDRVERMLAAQLEAGMFTDGPEIVSIGIDNSGGKHAILLGLSAPVDADSVPKKAFGLHRYDGKWKNVAVNTAFHPAAGSAPDLLRVEATHQFPEGKYRLALDPAHVDHTRPIVDAKLRPLRPLRPAIHFDLAVSGTTVSIADADYVS